MIKDIRRKDWARFCREFNGRNRLRTVTVRNQASGDSASGVLIGVKLLKAGRKIEAIGLYTACDTPHKPADLLVRINGPDSISLQKNQHGDDDRLEITAADGSKVTFEMSEQPDSAAVDGLVRRLAHSLYEARGRRHGLDQEDWFEAKRTLEKSVEEIA